MFTKEDFENQFETEEYEMLVLVTSDGNGSMRVDNTFSETGAGFFASIDLRTNTLSKEPGALSWLFKKNKKINPRRYKFKKLQIYHVLVRKCITKQLEKGERKIINNRYMLLKVLHKNVKNKALEELKKYYTQPVIIQNELGEFTLDRNISYFEGYIDWNGEKVSVSLETEDEKAQIAQEALINLAKDFEGNDIRFRKYAAKELTGLANDWLEEGADEITEDMFEKRISIGQLVINIDGSITVVYGDDDMFWGHYIEIEVDADGKMIGADIVG